MNRYEVLRCVHEGRLATVYHVREPGLGRELALKTISPSVADGRRDEALRGLRREAEVRAALEHPAFLPLYRFEESPEGPLLIGPWLAGGSVTERFRERGSAAAVAALVERVGHGLDALHHLGLVHGDLSPRNILFDRHDTPRIIDLASCVPIGSRFRESGQERRTWGTTAIVAAPELWTGEPVDGRADLYSLAVIAFFLLTGSWPFVADERAEILEQHAHRPAPAPSSVCALLGPEVDAVLLRALAKRPDDRFASGAELAGALARALVANHGTVAPAPAPAAGLLALADGALAEPPRVDDATLMSAWKALERFAGSLPPEQRAAFTALVGAVEREDAGASAATGVLLRAAIVPVAALAAAEELGLLHALAAGARTTAALAAACAAPEQTLARLCAYLRATGHLAEFDGRWSLRPPLLGAYRQGQRLGVDVRPVREALAHWRHLAAWVRTGEPVCAMDRDATGADYSDGTAYLGDASEQPAAQLAERLRDRSLVPDRAAILDVGAGSAVWSLALCAAWPEAKVTALDRPRVLDVAVARARAAGLADRLIPLPGDWQHQDLPAGAFDVVVLANFCHLLDRDSLAALLGRLRPALSARGRIVVVDTAPARLGDASEGALRYDLALALRTASGRVHDRAGYRDAMAAAGLELVHTSSLACSTGTLDVLLAAPA